MGIATAIRLASGEYFDYSRPRSALVLLDDIAHGLANLCRFNGQCREFYSVAEHSVHVSRILPPELALAGLLHDAAEFVLPDVPSPLKAMLPDFREVEAKVSAAIFRQLEVEDPRDPRIKAADLAVLAAEQQQVFDSAERWPMLDGVAPAGIRIEFLPPHAARGAFLGRYRAIMLQRRVAS